MTAAETATVQLAAQCGTHHPRDRAAQAILLRGSADRGLAVRAILDARAAWLNWLTVTQRQWQRETRRPSRARHHDSIELRRKYVEVGRA